MSASNKHRVTNREALRVSGVAMAALMGVLLVNNNELRAILCVLIAASYIAAIRFMVVRKRSRGE